MPQKSDITTFQFLEQLQRVFAKEIGGNGSGKKFGTRRLINFFNDSATLQVLPYNGNGTNGSSEESLATLRLQGVAETDEIPTFAINIDVRSFDKSQKLLVMVPSEDAIGKECSRVVGVLKTQMDKADQVEAEAEKVKAEAEAQAARAQAEAAAQARAEAATQVEPEPTPDVVEQPVEPPAPAAQEEPAETSEPTPASPEPAAEDAGSSRLASSRLRRRALRNREASGE